MTANGAQLAGPAAQMAERIRALQRALADDVQGTTLELQSIVQGAIKSAETLLDPMVVEKIDAAYRGTPKAKVNGDAEKAREWYEWAAGYLASLGELRQVVSTAPRLATKA
jgi:hypothetical protein